MQDDFSRLDKAFAKFLTARCLLKADIEKAAFSEIILNLSYAQSQGHSCLALNNQQVQIIEASGLANDLGDKPLVLERELLYLQRYWAYECQLAVKIQTLKSTTYTVKNCN